MLYEFIVSGIIEGSPFSEEPKCKGLVMNRLTGVGVGLVGFGAVLAPFSYFVLVNIPLTTLGVAFAILGLVILILPEYLVAHEVVRGMMSGSVANIEAVLEEFGAAHKAVYLPPREGKVYAYIPLSGNPSYPELNHIVNAPKRIISNVDGHPGLFIYPPGSDVLVLSGVAKDESIEEGEQIDGNEKPSLDDFLPEVENGISYCLVDFAEIASKVQVNLEENKVFLGMKNVKIEVEAPRFTRVLGSVPTSLAACVIAKVSKMPVKIVEERREGKWMRAVLQVGSEDG